MSDGRAFLLLGMILGILNVDARTTTFPTTTEPMTTETTTTDLPGCRYQGVIYPVGNHQTGYDASSNWCYGIVCEPNGHTYQWDDFNCHKTSTPPTTIPPSPPTTVPTGCVFEGHLYVHNTLIQEALDKHGNPCSTIYCNSEGVITTGHYDCDIVG